MQVGVTIIRGGVFARAPEKHAFVFIHFKLSFSNTSTFSRLPIFYHNLVAASTRDVGSPGNQILNLAVSLARHRANRASTPYCQVVAISHAKNVTNVEVLPVPMLPMSNWDGAFGRDKRAWGF